MRTRTPNSIFNKEEEEEEYIRKVGKKTWQEERVEVTLQSLTYVVSPTLLHFSSIQPSSSSPFLPLSPIYPSHPLSSTSLPSTPSQLLSTTSPPSKPSSSSPFLHLSSISFSPPPLHAPLTSPFLHRFSIYPSPPLSSTQRVTSFPSSICSPLLTTCSLLLLLLFSSYACFPTSILLFPSHLHLFPPLLYPPIASPLLSITPGPSPTNPPTTLSPPSTPIASPLLSITPGPSSTTLPSSTTSPSPSPLPLTQAPHSLTRFRQ
ncbi:hypothetical protein Pcinc_033192 [Petrolisthes cinctipes]|uniref:Uncharacterized protein n=1 Tax=Petrolisthes cinctipes TaxID=88211 RepID=A0AAE1K278_PETCI|nr:hypothetical protein Pcinc_033192 [Petrolisthes cinctipes]